MRRWIVPGVLAVMAAVGAANAQGYVQGSAGVTNMPWLDVRGLAYRLNTGYYLGASAGLRLNNILGPSWDLRGDIFYTRNNYVCCDSHLGGVSLMADLIYHFDVDLPVKPYVGAGIGGVQLQYGSPMSEFQDSQMTFGGQALAGAEYPLFGRFSAFAEYRFIAATNATLENIGNVAYQSHNFTIGLKMNL